MSAERRRLIAIGAALAVFLAAGVFWLGRLVFSDTTAARFEPATTTSAPGTAVPDTTGSAPGQPGATDPGDPAPGDPAPGDPPAGAPPADGPGNPRSTVTTAGAPTGTRTAPAASPKPATSKPDSPSSEPPPPPAPKTRVVQVGGVTLDNRNPQTMCTLFQNDEAGIPVTLGNIRVSGELTMKAGDCGTNGDIEGKPRCRDSATLPPGGSCFTGTAPTNDEPGEYAGWVRIDVRGKCTSAGPRACSGPELADDPPTRARPVIVTWTVRSAEPVCYAVRAPDDENQDRFCFKTPDGE